MNRKYIGSVDHIALQLPSLEEGLWFFHELLGFKVRLEVEHEGHHIVMLKGGKIELEMWQGENELNPLQPVQGPGVHHLAIQVKDLEAVISFMKEMGVEIVSDIYSPTRGINEAIVQGPGGLRVQFVEQNVPLLIWRSLKGDFKES